jgi:hypothetical protein
MKIKYLVTALLAFGDNGQKLTSLLEIVYLQRVLHHGYASSCEEEQGRGSFGLCLRLVSCALPIHTSTALLT